MTGLERVPGMTGLERMPGMTGLEHVSGMTGLERVPGMVWPERVCKFIFICTTDYKGAICKSRRPNPKGLPTRRRFPIGIPGL